MHRGGRYAAFGASGACPARSARLDTSDKVCRIPALLGDTAATNSSAPPVWPMETHRTSIDIHVRAGFGGIAAAAAAAAAASVLHARYRSGYQEPRAPRKPPGSGCGSTRSPAQSSQHLVDLMYATDSPGTRCSSQSAVPFSRRNGRRCSHPRALAAAPAA